VTAGGVLCRSCADGDVEARPLSIDALKALRLLQRASWPEIARVLPAMSREIESHLRSYIVYVLEREVNALAFIERLRREGKGLPVEV